MRLEIFRTLWGYRGSWQQALDEALSAGFDGLEARIPETAAQRAINARCCASRTSPISPPCSPPHRYCHARAIARRCISKTCA